MWSEKRQDTVLRTKDKVLSTKDKEGRIFVISGPSGSGKTTLLKSLLKSAQLKKKLVKSISFTTRPRRLGEKNGRDYFFISEKEFRQKQKAKKILEWTKYLDYYYATPRDFVERQCRRGRHLVLCLDLKGAAKIKELYPENTVRVFVAPPSLKTLEERIRGRSGRTERKEIQQRLKLAQKELLASHRYDYCILNSNLRRAAERLKSIIVKEINGIINLK